MSSDCFGFLISCLWSFLSFQHGFTHSSARRLWRYLQVHGEQANYRVLPFFLIFHLLNIIFHVWNCCNCHRNVACSEMGEKMSVRGSFPSDVVQTAIESGNLWTIASFHHFLPCFAPFSPISPNFLHDCGLPLSSPKHQLISRITMGASVGQEESMKAPLTTGVLLSHFPIFSPGHPRL